MILWIGGFLMAAVLSPKKKIHGKKMRKLQGNSISLSRHNKTKTESKK